MKNSLVRRPGLLTLALLLLAAFCWGPLDASAAGKVAVIDMQKVVRKSAAGKKAMEKLNKKFETLQGQLKKMQEEIKAFKDDMEKKGPLMNAEAKADKEREYKKMVRDFKEKSDDAQYEMKQAEAKLMEPIFKVIENVVTELGKKEGYTIILEKNMPGMYFSSQAADITDMVIKAYDKKFSGQAK